MRPSLFAYFAPCADSNRAIFQGGLVRPHLRKPPSPSTPCTLNKLRSTFNIIQQLRRSLVFQGLQILRVLRWDPASMVAEPLEPEPVIPRSADIDGVPMTVTMLHHAASGQGRHCTSWGAYGDRSLALGGSFSITFSAGHSSWGTMYRYVSRTSKAMQRHAKPTIKAPRRENWSWQSRPFQPFHHGSCVLLPSAILPLCVATTGRDTVSTPGIYQCVSSDAVWKPVCTKWCRILVIIIHTFPYVTNQY